MDESLQQSRDDLPGMWDYSDFLYGKTDAEEEAALPRRIPGASLAGNDGIAEIPPENFSPNEDISDAR